MQFLAYSDIHHDDYTNGLVENDIVSVEDQITQYALSNNISTVFFLGDWYRATNPNRSVIASAEASWKRRSDAGIMTYVLVGNHDRWTKSIGSGHAFVSANIFHRDLQNVTVFDDICVQNMDGMSFIFIPAGHEHLSNITSEGTTIVLFHGLVFGSALANGATASSGIHPESLRNLNADMILGGDNHTHQRLDDLLGCVSMYLGAPLQHNWGDRGQKRGFWHIDIVTGTAPKFNFIETVHPRFVRTKVDVKNEMDAVMKVTQLLNTELNMNPGIVEITFIGEHAKSLNLSTIENNMSHLDIRKLKLSVDRTYERLEIAQGIGNIDNPEEKWDHYLSNSAETKELNPQLLSDMGKWALQEARKLL